MLSNLFGLMLISLVFFNFATLKGQSGHRETFLLSGVLRDRASGEPVPYASIVIDGSNVGTSSSEDGRFHLAVGDADRLAYLRISSIGYSTKYVRIDSLVALRSLVIALTPSTIRLDTVLVEANRPSASDFVRDVIQSLEKNEYSDDYVLQWYTRMRTFDSATHYSYTLETVFDDYRISKKSQRVIRQQREIGISPILVADPKDTLCMPVPWFELGIADIRNAEYGVFNLKNLKDFAFTYEGVVGLNDDSVFVISYEAINRSYRVTGATNKKISYRGKLYITTSTNAVVRHTLEHGDDDLIIEEVLYKRISNYYFPYYIKSTRHLAVNKNFHPFHSNTYILRDVRFDNVQFEPGYSWCKNRAPYNEEFWESNYPHRSE